MQDARKGVLFDSFPPVLQLQLKRFEYDFQRDVMVKVRPSYSQQLCLTPLLLMNPPPRAKTGSRQRGLS